MSDDERGTGRTTEQMRGAAPNAMYVWCASGSLDYAHRLAHGLGRDDLKIVGPDVFDRNGERLRGMEITDFIVDHAVREHLTGKRREDYFDVMTWIGTRIRRRVTQA